MTPYQNVAKTALMNWNGLTEEQANQKIQTESVQELESQVYAMSSMEHATLGVANELGLGEEEKEQLWNAVINGPENAEIFSTVAQKANGFTNEQILNVLSTIHDGWVIDNSSDKTFQKKVDREQLRQYAPLELIGWNEVQSDLLFLNPILSSIGVSVNENQLSVSYHERVAKYFEQNNIDDYVSLVSLLEQGRQYYPTLPENLENNLKSMTGTMASQIVSNWTKKDSQTEQLFESRFDRILNVTPSTVVTTDAVDLPTSQVTVENSNRSPAPMFPTETELFTDSQHSMADVPDEALVEIVGPNTVIMRHSDGRVTFHQKQVGNDSISSTPIEVGEPVTPIEVESPINSFDNTSMGQPLTEDNSTQRVIDLMQQAMQDQMADGKTVGIVDNTKVTFDENGTIVDVEPIAPVEQADTSSKTM